MRGVETIRFTRRKLPHWEVENGRYLVTVRCADSLPEVAVARLSGLHDSLSQIEPRSAEFAAMQRQVFRTLEKYLDAGYGSCLLRQPEAARIVVDELAALADWQIAVPHFTVMPNHWHALLVPGEQEAHSLSAIMKRLKGRMGSSIRGEIGGRGPVWQSEWFDRWIRDEAEWEKIIAYIRNNPVKAGLARAWVEHRWTR